MKPKKNIFAVVICLGLFLSAPTAWAHELLPKALQDYVSNNPNATVEDIEAFIQTQPKDIRDLFASKDAVIKIIKNKSNGFWDNAKDFTKLGVEHILTGPDHILFVLSLLLVFISIKELLKLTSTFTVAHSITLLLAGSGVLVLSSRAVEPIIAFSICWVAITSVFFQRLDFFRGKLNKLFTVFFFGLFHGLGFAGVLREVHIAPSRFVSSLLFFNVGIEIGQLIVITSVLPLIYFCKDRPWYPKAIKIFAAGISALAFIWVVQRVFFKV